jgi:hypothetical protein
MLLGSGVSRAARVPTGWEVVLDLIGKVAALQGEDAAEDARADPEGWWRGQGHGEPRYDTMLESLAPSVAARRDLLHAYFEPADDAEREAGLKQPTAAHRAIAELVSSGRVRLILTTNFDHLMETALAEAGVPPQVIARADAIAGMAPLQHARATIIKLHGDYLDVQAIRNTPVELEAYDPAMKRPAREDLRRVRPGCARLVRRVGHRPHPRHRTLHDPPLPHLLGGPPRPHVSSRSRVAGQPGRAPHPYRGR